MRAGSCDIFIDIVCNVSILGELWMLYESHGHWESAFWVDDLGSALYVVARTAIGKRY